MDEAEEVIEKIINLQLFYTDTRRKKYLIPEAVEILKQYAQQVSRERAVEFELRHVYKGASKAGKKLAYMQFDEWIKNQQ